jgi:hypothetical protein
MKCAGPAAMTAGLSGRPGTSKTTKGFTMNQNRVAKHFALLATEQRTHNTYILSREQYDAALLQQWQWGFDAGKLAGRGERQHGVARVAIGFWILGAATATAVGICL